MGFPDLGRCRRIIRSVPLGTRAGTLTQVVGLLVECRGLSVALGDLCRIEDGRRPVEFEVVGFRGDATLLMPLGDADGLRPGLAVEPLGKRLLVPCTRSMLGRVLDGLGRPIDDGPPILPEAMMELVGRGPSPLDRVPLSEPLPTGISVIDGLLTLARGQRIGIFAGSGVGKSTLLADIAKGSLSDVNVIALIGERGREVKHFIHDALGDDGLARSIIVVATSDEPPLIRMKACLTAVAVAEYFRDLGNDVMMMVDSVTRLAGATREVGLALGEPPTVKGYPPSFFSSIPRLVERMGRTSKGSITGILTVLVDGDDMNEPVADTLRGLLDGHVVLSRAVAQRNRFPAVDVLQSTSRIMDNVTSPDHQTAARQVRSLLAAIEEVRDLVAVGAYKAGSDPRVDRAIAVRGDLEALLAQAQGENRPFDRTVQMMKVLSTGGRGG